MWRNEATWLRYNGADDTYRTYSKCRLITEETNNDFCKGMKRGGECALNLIGSRK